MKGQGPKVSVVIPTYNEAGNIGPLIRELCRALEGYPHEVIIVDDNSPDGTAEVARRVARELPQVKVLTRPGKLGLGSAVMEGLRASEGDLVLMMDADFSHRPQDVPRLLERAGEADIVLGSRYVPGGRVEGWPWRRRLASRVAVLYSRLVLGLGIRDTTTGFALFRRDLLERLEGRTFTSGFKLALEVVVRSPDARVVEVPITFHDRREGKSKFSLREVLEFLVLCWRLRRERRAGPADSPSVRESLHQTRR